MPSTPLVEVRALRKSYPTGSGGRLLVLDDLNMQVERAEVLAIVGESGVGKSTFLHLLGALDRPDSGEILFEDANIFDKDDEELATFRNRSIGFIFQFHHLLPEFTALENVMMPALIRRQGKPEAEPRAAELLELLGLKERLDHRPAALSGGEQQRVAVARALMNRPALVLADEPSGNLDADTAEYLHDELIRLSRMMGQTFIIATHNPMLAQRADRILRLANHALEPA